MPAFRAIGLLLPNTDAGVFVQVGALVVVFSVLLAVTWRHSEFRTLVIGVFLLLAGFMGVRAVH